MSLGTAIVILAFSSLARAASDSGTPESFGHHYGYTFDVAAERQKRDIEMVLPEAPREPKAARAVLVNEKLSREFQAQYEYRFGKTQAEQVFNSPGRNDEYTYYTGKTVTLQDYRAYQRQFAEYMGRRLTEYHVDNWAKNDPQLRPVYEMKDRIGHLDVTVRKGYNVKWKYNFAGPSMDVNVENPYDVEMRARMEMSGVISSPSEYIYTLGYPLTQRVTLSALYKQTDGIYQLVCSRRVTSSLSASITGSVDTLKAGPTVQQNLVLLGLSWSE